LKEKIVITLSFWAPSALIYICIGSEVAERFVYTTKQSLVLISFAQMLEPIGFKRLSEDKKEVTTIATRPVSSIWRIALALQDGTVQVWTADSSGDLMNGFSIRITGAVPRTVAFDVPRKAVLVFDLRDGRM
jgi:hypothetical protein